MNQFNNRTSLSKDFLVTTVIQKDEFISGYLARNRFNSGSCLIEKTKSKMGKYYLNSWSYLPNLSGLHQVLSPALPDAESLLKKHSIYPFLRPFQSNERKIKLKAHFLEKVQPGLASMIGYQTRGGPYRWQISVCLKCVDEDYATHGFSYWRTAHAIPGIRICAFHKDSLYTYCGKCGPVGRYQSVVVAPTLKCLCGNALKPICEGRNTHLGDSRIAEYVRRILDGEIPAFVNAEILYATIRHRAHKLFGSSYDSILAANQRALERLGNSNVTYYRMNDNFWRFIHKKSHSLNAVQFILVLITVFETFEDFVEFLSKREFQELLSLQNCRKPPKFKYGWTYRAEKWKKFTPDQLNALREKSRLKFQSLQSTYSTEKRGMLAKRRPALLQFLRGYDNDWLQNCCPPSSSDNQVSNRIEKLDSVISQHIWNEYDNLKMSGLDTRISKRRLLFNSPRRNLSVDELNRLPLTTNALKQCEESSHDYRIRGIEFRLNKNSEVCKFIVIPKDFKVLGVTAITLVWKEVKKWEKQFLS